MAIKKEKATNPVLTAELLPFDYTTREWFMNPMEDVSQLSVDIHQGIISSRTLLFFIQVGSLLIICFIVWLSFRAFRRYKDQYVDPEKDHLVEQLAKLREVNTRLIRRNQDLAEKVAKLQNHLKTVSSQSSESHYFG